MDNKKQSRIRRARPARAKIRELKINRLSVNRTPRHIYAQIITATGNVISSASTLEGTLRSKSTGNIDAAKAVGKLIAERAKSIGIKKIAFDRSGFKYHGRVKSLADAARKSGLQF